MEIRRKQNAITPSVGGGERGASNVWKRKIALKSSTNNESVRSKNPSFKKAYRMGGGGVELKFRIRRQFGCRFATDLCRCPRCRYNPVPAGCCNPARPSRPRTCTATRCRHSPGTVRAPNSCSGSPPTCSACRSSRSRTGKCRSCTVRVRCTGRRTVSYCSTDRTSRRHSCTCRPRNGRARRSPDRTVLRDRQTENRR